MSALKMQTIPYCFKKLLSPVYKSRVMLTQAGVFRCVCSLPRTCCSSSCLHRPANGSSSQRRYHVNSSPFDTQRLYSEICGESSPERSAGAPQEEPREEDNVSKERPSEKFSLDVLVSLLRQENALDICVINVPEQLKYAEYFVVVSGISTRHLRAMALYAVKVFKFMKTKGEPHIDLEGKDADDWMCIDFGKIVVHFMLPETREKYELEKLWTLRSFDEQLMSIPAEKLPEDFIYDVEDTK